MFVMLIIATWGCRGAPRPCGGTNVDAKILPLFLLCLFLRFRPPLRNLLTAPTVRLILPRNSVDWIGDVGHHEGAAS